MQKQTQKKMFANFYKYSVLILCSFFLTQIFFSCKKNSLNQKNSVETLEEKKITAHKWFYFTQNDFAEIDYPENAPQKQNKPWTESVRISTFNSTPFFYDEKNPDEKNFSYAIVNHLGLLEFNNEKINLYKDAILFENMTADNLVFFNEMPVFTIYKNQLFNETINANLKNKIDEPVLIEFDKNAKTFFPIIDTKILKLKGTEQISDSYFDGKDFFYCIKNLTEQQTNFNYIKFSPKIDLNASATKSFLENSSFEKITKDDFRKTKTPNDFSNAPQRLKDLLFALPKDFEFLVECKMQNGASPKYFIKTKKKSAAQNSENIFAEAKAFLGKYFSACLFSDGTIYFSGALNKKQIVNNNKPCALRLPKLPNGFQYTDFTICNDNLFASWEESTFFEVARSGFLQVDLDKILYNNSTLK